MVKKIILLLISMFILSSCGSTKDAIADVNEKGDVNGYILLLNPNFTVSKNWEFVSQDNSAFWDYSESYSKGSGSAKLSNSDKSWNNTDQLHSSYNIPVEAGKSYTLALKTKTNTWPPPSIEVFGAYKDEKQNGLYNSLGTSCVNSQADIWEESFVEIKVPDDSAIKYFSIRIFLDPKVNIDGAIWIDDIRFSEDILLPKATVKKTFDGTLTRIDKFGNFEVSEDGIWKPFFPIGIYTDNKKVDWTQYANQGFNINMWASSDSDVQKAANAGLYSAMQLSQYLIPNSFIDGDENQKLEHLEQTLENILKSSNAKNMLFYYIDNEFYDLDNFLVDVNDKVRLLDKGERPIYMLNGAYGMARKYTNLVDITGTYVANDGSTESLINHLEIMDKTPNLTMPANFAQMNYGVGENFKAILFGAIAKGAKAMGYWRDGGSTGNDISSRAWWGSLPQIKTEIDQMMPLIRSDHHTSWSVECNNEKVTYGTRSIQDLGYMIISNPTAEEVKLSCIIKDLPYKITGVEDYFTKENQGSWSDNSIEIVLPRHGTQVITLN